MMAADAITGGARAGRVGLGTRERVTYSPPGFQAGRGPIGGWAGLKEPHGSSRWVDRHREEIAHV